MTTGNGIHTPGEAFSLSKLIKLLKLTTSTNNAEALLAMRKANDELKKLNKDWEEILTGKITVIGDPFADIKRPTIRPAAPPPTPQPRPAPQRFTCADCARVVSHVTPYQGRSLCTSCYNAANRVRCDDCNRLVFTAAPWQGKKLCPTCLNNAQTKKTITNKYGKACISCGTYVEAGTGKATKYPGSNAWVVHHDNCPATMRRGQAPTTDQL